VHFDFGVTPALTVALALAVGIIAQSLARHMRIPGIVILLGSGAVLGPTSPALGFFLAGKPMSSCGRSGSAAKLPRQSCGSG
jgi:Kef-type K+ transport system membrane component KefB